MLFGIGAAASAIDLLKSLTSPKATGGSGKSSGFDPSTASSAFSPSGTTGVSSSPQSGCLSPATLGAMLDAQGSATATSSTADSSRSKAMKDLLALLDGDGDGKVSKGEFESALGVGGTNTAKAGEVFGKMDADGDGSISLSEMSSALKGRHRPHTHKADAQPTDPLLQALDSTNDTSSTDANSTAATTSYNFMERALQSQAQALARSAMPQLSVSV